MKYITLFLVLLIVGCGQQKDVSFDTLEQARSQAKDNATFNAQAYRQSDPRIQQFGIISNGDSTQDNGCPQGDGWATVKLVSKDNTQTINLKCSTVSASVGCMFADEFKTKIYSGEEGHCQSITKVPFPFRKITQ